MKAISSTTEHVIDRRAFALAGVSGLASLCTVNTELTASTPEPNRLRYILASALYGTMPLATILPEVKKTGADAIDIWPQVHGNQREQIDAMGAEAFAELLAVNGIKLGGIASYRPGPFKLESEMELVRRLNQKAVVLVSGAGGKKNIKKDDLRSAIKSFVEKMKPHVAAAEQAGCVIAIENHSKDLLETPDAIRIFGELAPSPSFGLALAPHHLPQDPKLIAGLVRDLGPAVKFFYAQQHGKGSSAKLPKEEELLQMPGRGSLDFAPILAALAKIKFTGYTEIFMHPVPRGVPILESAEAITAEVNASRKYLDGCLTKS